jgi:hypothetical protein
MPASLSLEQIIRQECVPVLDCMLTITDDTGEAAFLYFKEGELVEANFASLWGRDALVEILKWKITSRTIASLPLGIKRSLWESLEVLLHPDDRASVIGGLATPTAPIFKTRRSATGPLISVGLDRYKSIPNLLKIVEIGRDKESVLFQCPPDKGPPEETEWLIDFANRVRAVGETLGFGGCDKWTIETDKNQIVGFSRDDKFIALVRRRDAMQEDLEAAVNAIAEGK